MSQMDFTDSTEVSIRLLDRTYQIRCPAHEQDDLFKAAKFLDAELRRTREAGVVGIERLAIMTSLNLASDYLQAFEKKETISKDLDSKVRDIEQRLDEVLAGAADQLELDPA